MVYLDMLHEGQAAAVQAMANNAAIARYLKDVFPHPYQLSDAYFFLGTVVPLHPGQIFGIYTDEGLAGIGSTLLQSDVYRHSAEIGYWLAQPFWGRGIGTEAVRLLTAHAFSIAGITRVFAGVFANNPASMRVLEKNGYRCEAVHKAAIVKWDVVMDEHLYTLLKPEHP
ncbi:GNAT family N-acetyltransferase [Pedobacter yulinensis]|uniref:GNAT family N-acetyltransferase n=1 Tax=Pedobacter yulinensis TaxID=2126353 RepID=A0A2T3HJK2_9SPHI|nr:GNAT family protein [Pedobacter yulinensis]PST82599.1 GNAT family N-acetyltransferase [Pedobacter yulinensis]